MSYCLQNRFNQILTWGKNVQHDEIYLWSNFCVNLLSHVRRIAFFLELFWLFLILLLQKSSSLTLLNQLEPVLNVHQGILPRSDVDIFDPLKNMAVVTKNRT